MEGQEARPPIRRKATLVGGVEGLTVKQGSVRDMSKQFTMRHQQQHKSKRDGGGGADGDVEDIGIHGAGRPLPLQYVIQNMDARNSKTLLYGDMVLYWPFLVMFLIFFLYGRDIEMNHMAASSIRTMVMDNFYESVTSERQQALEAPPNTIPNIDSGRKFKQISTAEHWYEWLSDVLLPYTWDCENPNFSRQTLISRGQMENIGALRLRVQLMPNTSCQVNTDFIAVDAKSGKAQVPCYRTHKASSEEVAPTCNRANPAKPDEMLWRYYDPSEISAGSRTTGVIGFYHTGGYVATLPFNSTCNMVNRFADLIRYTPGCAIVNTSATRFAMAEWFQYSTNTDTFLMAKLFVEVTSGGAFIATHQVRMFPVWTMKRLGMSIFDIFFFIFVLYFFYRLMLDWIVFYRRYKKIFAFCFDMWNLLEVMNIFTFLAVFVFRWVWWSRSRSAKIDFPFTSAYPDDLDDLVLLFMYQIYANSINVVITMLKVLKYLRLNNRMNVLTRTLAFCQQSILGVLVLFVFIVLGYAICGTALYGANLKSFRNVNTSFSSLMFMLLGQFQYEEMRRQQPALTWFYFFTFMVLSFFLLLNFLIAILSDGFAQVSGETALEPLDQAIIRWLVGWKYTFNPKNIKKILELRIKRKTRGDLLLETEKYLKEHMDLIELHSPELLDNDLPMHKSDLKHWLPEALYNDLGAFYINLLWDDMEHDYGIDVQAADYQEKKEIERAVQTGAATVIGKTLEDVQDFDALMVMVEKKVKNVASRVQD